MKKILLIALFSFTLFANTNSCMLDVYFGNGVWNDDDAKLSSAKELKRFMRDNICTVEQF